MKKLVACITLLTIYSSIHNSDAQRPNNDAHEIYIWHKQNHATQICHIALANERPDIATKIGTYAYGDSWLSQIKQMLSRNLPYHEQDHLIRFQAMEDIKNKFPDLKMWIENHPN